MATVSGPRHARPRRGRHRRRQPATKVAGKGVLAAAGVALLIAVSAATAAPGQPSAPLRKPQQHQPMPPIQLGADGGVVPAVPMPRLPLPPLPPMATGPAHLSPVPVSVVVSGGTVPTSYVGGIPAIVLAAYQAAAANLAQSQPNCRLPVALLAAIGKVESGHARGGRVDANGTAVPPILGPLLDGTGGVAAIPDTDNGALDGNIAWDRAVGPMQFLPSTWRRWASDGNHDGVADPENIWDASVAAARYLCADGRDLSTETGIQAAVLSYNHSAAYLNLVGAWLTAYRGGIVEVADVTQSTTVDTGATAPVSPVIQPTIPPTSPSAPALTTSPPPPGQPVTTAPTTATQPTAPAPLDLVAPQQPTTTTPAPPAEAPPPVDLVCGLQDTLSGLGGLLGLGLLSPAQSCEPGPTQPTRTTG